MAALARDPVPSLRACSREQVVDREVRVTHDLPEQPTSEVTASVYGHRHPSPIDVPQDDVAAALSNGHEASPLEDADDLAARERRKARAHTATRILVAPTSW